MKKLIYTIALFGLVVMTACSGDSPGAPRVPTVVPQQWGISSFDVDDPYPYLNQAVYLTVEATQNGLAAPDGTPVEFIANVGCFDPDGPDEGCAGFSNTIGRDRISVQIEDGVAHATFFSNDAGERQIQARVHDATDRVDVVYHDYVDPPTEELVIIPPLIPNIGSFDGGETVILRGTGIRSPAEVAFFVQGRLYPAEVTEVIESVPLSAPGEIRVTTPNPTLADRNQSGVADVTVQRGVGTPLQQLVNLPSAFTFLNVINGGPPLVYRLDPNFGGSQGGDMISFLGRNFVVGETTVRWFGDNLNVTTPIEDVSVALDGLSMAVITPRFSLGDLFQDLPASVEVTTPNGQFTLNNAFLILADDPSPLINSLSPIAGPLGGGTLVTIYGTGFQIPARVDFGDLTAIDVNVTNDPTPGGIDVITCLSPDYSQQGQVPPVVVGVTVTNLESNNPNRTSGPVDFTYGDNLFISGNSPTEGRPGDQVVIYGAGFEDPLQAFFLGISPDLELEVQSVSGTEILTRFPADLEVTCTDRTGQFRVRLIESNQETTGGTFTLRGNQPTVTGVDPTFVQATNFGNDVTPTDVTISGGNFAETLLVSFNSFVMASSSVTVVDESTIEVTGIPAPNDFGLVFDTTPCITSDGLHGLRFVPTSVSVSVANLPGDGCVSEPPGVLIYEPWDSTCIVSPAIGVAPLVFPPTDYPAVSPPQPLYVSNSGSGELDILSLNVGGYFYFNEGCTQTSAVATPHLIPPLTPAPGIAVANVYFCPPADTGLIYDGQLSITSNDPGSPTIVTFSAQEAFPQWTVNGGTAPLTITCPDDAVGGGAVDCTPTVTIANNGTGTLTWWLDKVGDEERFFIQGPPPDREVDPGQSVVYRVRFTADAVGSFSAVLTVTANETDAQPLSVDIIVSGNGI